MNFREIRHAVLVSDKWSGFDFTDTQTPTGFLNFFLETPSLALCLEEWDHDDRQFKEAWAMSWPDPHAVAYTLKVLWNEVDISHVLAGDELPSLVVSTDSHRETCVAPTIRSVVQPEKGVNWFYTTEEERFARRIFGDSSFESFVRHGKIGREDGSEGAIYKDYLGANSEILVMSEEPFGSLYVKDPD